ncbi:amidohydrolase family protein [Altibacter lentus]|uniref:amidohydrolase family protein n=1 Tax=Altibacter lentus TaxID=1223410 RepID=UPI0013626226|nr:amidohydrolase family protein [Altibacter lentus]
MPGQEENPKSDAHVHIMSPQLIKAWKELGIPFSKNDDYYANIDSILKTNNVAVLNLIGMGYVYGNPEFYQGNDAYEKLVSENNYVLRAAKKYPTRVTPYISIDPLHQGATEELKRCVSIHSDVGLKLHFNTSQVYLTEPDHLEKIREIFALASKYRTPILLHFDNGHPKFGKPDVILLVKSVLSEVDALNITIAHFGTSGGFNQKTKQVIDAFSQLKSEGEIPSKHRIRFDISAVALDKDSDGVKKLTEKEFSELKLYCEKIGYENIVFGTDYPLYTAAIYSRILREKLGLEKFESDSILHKNLAPRDTKQ